MKIRLLLRTIVIMSFFGGMWGFIFSPIVFPMKILLVVILTIPMAFTPSTTEAEKLRTSFCYSNMVLFHFIFMGDVFPPLSVISIISTYILAGASVLSMFLFFSLFCFRLGGEHILSGPPTEEGLAADETFLDVKEVALILFYYILAGLPIRFIV